MMSPFPPNLAKFYRLVLGGLWLDRMSTVCLSNLGLFMFKLLFGRMFIRIDASPWLGSRLACFWLVSGGIWAFFAFMPPCCLVFAWSLFSRLVAGLFVPFPQSAFVRLLGFVPWLAVGLLVSFSSLLLDGFSLAFFPPGPSGFLLVVLATVSWAFVPCC